MEGTKSDVTTEEGVEWLRRLSSTGEADPQRTSEDFRCSNRQCPAASLAGTTMDEEASPPPVERRKSWAVLRVCPPPPPRPHPTYRRCSGYPGHRDELAQYVIVEHWEHCGWIWSV